MNIRWHAERVLLTQNLEDFALRHLTGFGRGQSFWWGDIFILDRLQKLFAMLRL